MKKEFNLSDKIWKDKECDLCFHINIENVTEFIILLKNEIETVDWEDDSDILNIIDKLAGDKLSGDKLKEDLKK